MNKVFEYAILCGLIVIVAIVTGSSLSPLDELKARTIGCESDMECENASGIPYDVAMGDYPKYPPLVGFGCEGTIGAPIYGFEEDHFPRCREIRPMNWE